MGKEQDRRDARGFIAGLDDCKWAWSSLRRDSRKYQAMAQSLIDGLDDWELPGGRSQFHRDYEQAVQEVISTYGGYDRKRKRNLGPQCHLGDEDYEDSIRGVISAYRKYPKWRIITSDFDLQDAVSHLRHLHLKRYGEAGDELKTDDLIVPDAKLHGAIERLINVRSKRIGEE